jgi:transposase
MIAPTSGARVGLASGMTDMRRGMNSLALQVQQVGRDAPITNFRTLRGSDSHCVLGGRLER